MKSDQQFLRQLQHQAELQSHLSTTRVLPKHADWLTTWIGNNPWQTLVMLSTVSTFLMMVFGKV